MQGVVFACMAAGAAAASSLEPQDPRMFFDQLLIAKDQALMRARNLEAMLMQERELRGRAEAAIPPLEANLAAAKQEKLQVEERVRGLEKEVSELTVQLERESKVRKAASKPLYQAALAPYGLTPTDTMIVDWSPECASMVKVLDVPDSDTPNLPHVESAIRTSTGQPFRITLAHNASFSVVDANSISQIGTILARISARDNVENLARLFGSIRGSAEGLNTLRRRALKETAAAMRATEWAKGHITRIENASNATEAAFNTTEAE